MSDKDLFNLAQNFRDTQKNYVEARDSNEPRHIVFDLEDKHKTAFFRLLDHLHQMNHNDVNNLVSLILTAKVIKE